MTGVVQRFRRAFAWAAICDAERMGRPKQALERLDRLVARLGVGETRAGPADVLRAYRALLLLQMGRMREASVELVALRTQLAGSIVPRDQYIRRFCQSHLAGLHGDPYTAFYEGRKAIELPASDRIKRLLWVNLRRHDPEWDAANEGLAQALTLARKDQVKGERR